MRTVTAIYAPRIARAIDTNDSATIALVEDLMRDGRSGLDGLSTTAFARVAREAMATALVIALAGELVDYCEAVGLAVPTLRI
jgi:uncharacterized protein (UPF0264 family)